jgi:hypothetical protein
MQWEEWNDTHHGQGQPASIPVSPLSHMPSAITLSNFNMRSINQDIETAAASRTQGSMDDLLLKINARVVVLSGYVCESN